jgi:hypothetical protein
MRHFKVMFSEVKYMRLRIYLESIVLVYTIQHFKVIFSEVKYIRLRIHLESTVLVYTMRHFKVIFSEVRYVRLRIYLKWSTTHSVSITPIPKYFPIGEWGARLANGEPESTISPLLPNRALRLANWGGAIGQWLVLANGWSQYRAFA